MDKVSIVVPVYNSEKYMIKCIDSILNQTYKNLELILVDDGSTDKSYKICDEYEVKDSRIKVFHNENHGPSFSRNFGIAKTTGDYLTFVDADDWLDENAIEISLQEIKKTNADVIFFNLREVINGRINEYKIFEKEHIIFEGKEKDKLEKILIIPEKYTDKLTMGLTGSMCKLYKVEIIKDCSFPEDFNYAEDYCFIAQVIKKSNKIVYTNKIIYNYQIRKDSLSHKISIDFIEKNLKVVNWFLEFYKDSKDYEVLNEFVFKYYAIIWSHIIMERKLTMKEKKKEMKKFLNKVNFNYDFAIVDRRCKNRNLRVVWFLVQKRFFITLYFFMKLVEIKNKI